METKQCTKCKIVKQKTEFNKDIRAKNGLSSACKKCCCLQNKKYKKNYEKYGLGVGTVARFGFKLALEVYDKAERKCQKCGEVNNLTIHHLDNNGRNNEEKGLPVNNDIKNLIVLCRRCHGSIHGKETMKNGRIYVRPHYKEKECLICKIKFIPIWTNHKFCKECKKGR